MSIPDNAGKTPPASKTPVKPPLAKPATAGPGAAAPTAPNQEMVKKLSEAGKKAEEQKEQRRERTVKGSHLLAQLRELAEKAKLRIDEKSGFLKITGSTKGRTVYVAKKGGRVDISGFEMSHPAVKGITEADAREKHLGKVRGQIDFDQPDAKVVEAYSKALEELSRPAPAAAKPVPATEAPKAASAA